MGCLIRQIGLIDKSTLTFLVACQSETRLDSATVRG